MFGQKWLYSCKVVVLEQNGCIRGKMHVFGQKWFYSGKSVVFGQKLLYLGKVVIWRK